MQTGLLITILVGLLVAASGENSSQSTNRLQDCGTLSHGSVIPDEYNCAKYLVCVDGILQSYTCPEWNSYNATNNMCLYDVNCWQLLGPCYGRPTGTILPYPLSCRQYYICNAGQALLGFCPIGYAYSSLVNNCVPNTTQCV